MRESPSEGNNARSENPPSARNGAGGPANSPPSISLPKGGGAIQGIGEKFAMNPVTGTASFSIPIFASPGRADFGPKLTLSYDSGAGNGPFGLGWRLGIPSITRKTSKGLPQYRDRDESDVFLISDAEDLVPELISECSRWVKNDRVEEVAGQRFEVRRYRPRIEGLFARIERWRNAGSGETHWRSISRDNITSVYGRTPEARIADTENPNRVFQWMLERSWDDKGNAIVYGYKREELPSGRRRLSDRHRSEAQSNLYLERILYGNRTASFVEQGTRDIVVDDDPKAWLFELVFDYAKDHDPTTNPLAPTQWSVREDPFSTYNATFEIRTWRLCHRVLMFHRFEELDPNPYLVRSTSFTYEENPVVTYLTAATQSGYRWDHNRFNEKSYPPVEFDYERLRSFHSHVEELDSASLQNLPIGLESGYQLLDLDGEGIAGVLAEQGGAWFFKRNLGEVRTPRDRQSPFAPPHIVERPPVQFAPVETVAARPNLANSGKHQFLDLAGNGQIDLVLLDQPAGFFERTTDESWESFRAFESLPNLDFNNPNLRFIDLTGDGHADILISEDQAFVWHESLAEQGFGVAHRVAKVLDEEKGPAVVFAEEQQTVFLADMSGDGLNDLVRVRNGEISYWPNLGYGCFGAKVTMEDSPWFDLPDQFDSRRIRLGDLDGSGPADLLYIRPDHVSIWRNQSGNSWRAEESIRIPGFHSLASVNVADLLGRGTASIVWSSRAPGDVGPSLRYIDLVGKKKPHLLRRMTNNLGAETHLHYASSTKFYLADRLAGRPWITHLPFPVHVCEKVETFDRISKNYFVTRYAFHHGYFDGVEREFRGFGMVEQWDTESFAALSASDVFPTGDNIDRGSHLPPVQTKTWFHTGVFLDREHISNFYAGFDPCPDSGARGEYYREPGLDDTQAKALLLDDTILPDGLTLDEQREACRALKGSILRQEVYALDDSPKAKHPYSVSERNYTVRLLQPRGPNRFADFLTHARETLDYHYERNPSDPRISHSLTLEADEFGNVLKSAAVGYGRREPDCTLPPRDREEQTRTLVTYTESAFTNPILDMATAYRTPLPAEVRTYELTGYTPSGAAGRFRISDFVRNSANGLAHVFATEIPYEQQAGPGKKRRPIEQVRIYYRPDDFGDARGDALALLPLGQVESLAVTGESFKLAFTPGLLAQVYRRGDENLLPDPASVLAADITGGHVADRGGYVDLDGNGHWWIPSGRMFHSPGAGDESATEVAYARNHFYLAQRYRDPFGEITAVTFDAHDLLTVETRDPLSNRVTAGERDTLGNLVSQGNDYRVLHPRLVMDPNRNRMAVAFDILGMVVGTAVMGKPEESLGDSLDGFDPDLTEAAILNHLANPFADAHSILGSATSRLVYDLFAYSRTKAGPQPQPAVVYTMARETHAADLEPGQQTKIQHSFSYSDGFGREIQKKIQAEPARLSDGTRSSQPRWVGSGWTVFNNKGKPVRQYEPFFTDHHRFEFDVRIGVSPVIFYDPVVRMVATLHPNHTWGKVVFDPWKQETWDVNDTVLSGDPKNDPDVGDFFRSLPEAEYLPTWHAARQEGALGPQEQAAAAKAAAHADTPSANYFDTLGRPFMTVADNALDSNGHEQKYRTRTYLDIEGNQREVIDAFDRVVMRYDHDMLSTVIHSAGVDAGERWMLNDLTGKPIRKWDSRAHTIRMAYDALKRPTHLFVSEGIVPEILAERLIYGEAHANAEALNLGGKLYKHYDGAGVATDVQYDFKGNVLSSTRQLAIDYRQQVDWAALATLTDAQAINSQVDALLETETFTTGTEYDALNRPTRLAMPDNSKISPTYNEANLLERVDARLRGAGETTPLVTGVSYDAKGQRMQIGYGNGASTNYEYDERTFRLTRLRTKRSLDEAKLQDLSYTYDPVGNITSIRDDAQQTIYFNNQVVTASAEYEYDAIYRLLYATGREHLGQTGGQPNAPRQPDHDDSFWTNLPHPRDGNAMGNYTERYEYDEIGNILKMIHRAATGSWTRNYQYALGSNRLLATSNPSGSLTDKYDHDAHGNMVKMPHLPQMQWDFRDQLRVVDLGGGGNTFYTYESSGHRVRKVWAKPGGLVEERIYLGDYEVFRRSVNGTVTLERETLRIMDDTRRVALVETKTVDNAALVSSPSTLWRYQIDNHLGSACLELNEMAAVVSYEEYYPYGNSSYRATDGSTEIGSSIYRYTNKEKDQETGLYNYGARYYACWLGRWISADPAGLVDGVDPYVYVKSNPILNNDPEGLQAHHHDQGKAKADPKTGKMTAKIYFQFDSDVTLTNEQKAAYIETYRQNVIHTWGQFTYKGNKVDASGATFESVEKRHGKEGYLFTVGRGKSDPAIKEGEPNDQISYVVPKESRGYMYYNSGAPEGAHEFGHLFGLADRYHEGVYREGHSLEGRTTVPMLSKRGDFKYDPKTNTGYDPPTNLYSAPAQTHHPTLTAHQLDIVFKGKTEGSYPTAVLIITAGQKDPYGAKVNIFGVKVYHQQSSEGARTSWGKVNLFGGLSTSKGRVTGSSTGHPRKFTPGYWAEHLLKGLGKREEELMQDNRTLIRQRSR